MANNAYGTDEIQVDETVTHWSSTRDNADESDYDEGTSEQVEDKAAEDGNTKIRSKAEREKKLGHRRVGVGGEITYKKIQTSQIMGSIQLGIQHAVGGLASKPERDLLMQDFMTVETTVFTSDGSNHTPAHHYSDFTFKTYAPIAFRYFRDLFGIQPDDFLISFCSAPLRELVNPGASGSIFYLTQDDEFIMKTVQHKEGEFLQKLLPGYYMNLNQNPRTLLPKFFGLYCYQCNSKNIRLVAMNNLLPSSVKLHLKYDLKGSTYKRKASKSERQKKSPTYKDLDFMEHHPEGLFLEAETYNALVKTMQRDCRVLESFKIMDYSLLVGIHNLDISYKEKMEKRGTLGSTSESDGVEDTSNISLDDRFQQDTSTIQVESDIDERVSLSRTRSVNKQKLVAHSTPMETIQAETEPVEVEDLPPGGIPARNAKGERLLLFLGIIDILQSYRLKKKVEHTLKALIHDGDTVSVHKPGFYAQRFQDFMAKTVFKKIPSPLKHSPSKRKSFSRPLLKAYDIDLESNALPSTSGNGASERSSTPATLPLSSPLSQHHFTSPHLSPLTMYPSVLKDRLCINTIGSTMAPKVPPPVPPRGVRNKVRPGLLPKGYFISGSIPSCSTPPPAFDDAIKNDHLVEKHVTMASTSTPLRKQGINSSSLLSSNTSHTKYFSPVINVSDVKLHMRVDSRSTHSVGSGSSISESTISSSRSLGHRSNALSTGVSPSKWVDSNTPTWTEGTPSYTESSSSGELGSVGKLDKDSVKPVHYKSINIKEEPDEENNEITEVTHL